MNVFIVVLDNSLVFTFNYSLQFLLHARKTFISIVRLTTYCKTAVSSYYTKELVINWRNAPTRVCLQRIISAETQSDSYAYDLGSCLWLPFWTLGIIHTFFIHQNVWQSFISGTTYCFNWWLLTKSLHHSEIKYTMSLARSGLSELSVLCRTRALLLVSTFTLRR